MKLRTELDGMRSSCLVILSGGRGCRRRSGPSVCDQLLQAIPQVQKRLCGEGPMVPLAGERLGGRSLDGSTDKRGIASRLIVTPCMHHTEPQHLATAAHNHEQLANSSRD